MAPYFDQPHATVSVRIIRTYNCSLCGARSYGENAIHDVISGERASITRWSSPTSKYFQRRSAHDGSLWKSFDPTESRFEPRGLSPRGENREKKKKVKECPSRGRYRSRLRWRSFRYRFHEAEETLIPASTRRCNVLSRVSSVPFKATS